MNCELNGGYINHLSLEENRIIKQFAGEERIGFSRKQRLLRELWSLRYFEQSLVPVPKILTVDFGSCRLNMTSLFGIPLDDYLRCCEQAEKEAILFQAGQLLRSIHNHTASDISWRTVLSNYFSQTDEALDACWPILKSELIKPTSLFNILVANLDPTALEWVGVTHIHGDYWLNNLIYNQKQRQIVGVVDWELSGIGSPYADFAIVHLWIEREHENIESFWQGYGDLPHQKTVRAWLLGRCLQFFSDNFFT